MSKYMLNKFMRAVEMSDANVAAYVADPAAFVEEWCAVAAGPDSRTDDRALTDRERVAFAERDYHTLYALGAHPYLLWHFTEAVYIHEVPWRELVEAYRRAVAPLGEPDFVA